MRENNGVNFIVVILCIYENINMTLFAQLINDNKNGKNVDLCCQEMVNLLFLNEF
jgi:hypothetical protein